MARVEELEAVDADGPAADLDPADGRPVGEDRGHPGEPDRSVAWPTRRPGNHEPEDPATRVTSDSCPAEGDLAGHVEPAQARARARGEFRARPRPGAERAPTAADTPPCSSRPVLEDHPPSPPRPAPAPSRAAREADRSMTPVDDRGLAFRLDLVGDDEAALARLKQVRVRRAAASAGSTNHPPSSGSSRSSAERSSRAAPRARAAMRGSASVAAGSPTTTAASGEAGGGTVPSRACSVERVGDQPGAAPPPCRPRGASDAPAVGELRLEPLAGRSGHPPPR